MQKKKVVRMFSPLTARSWQAEERRSLNAPRHLSPLYGEKRLVDITVTAQESQMTVETHQAWPRI